MADIYFGGPDHPYGHLRDRLEAAVHAVPNGGWIRWATYYFRDVRLAKSLVDAHRRGVQVVCALASRPRIANANRPVIDVLAGRSGIGSGLRLLDFRWLPTLGNRSLMPQLHLKIYTFSHPEPIAMVGSFNPSGTTCDRNPETVLDIGDQDIGDNLLVAFNDVQLVAGLKRHVETIHDRPWTIRTWTTGSGSIRGQHGIVHFWPRRRRHPILRLLDGIGEGARLRIFASHIRNRALVAGLQRLAASGADIRVLADATHRRFPLGKESALVDAGVTVVRAPRAQPWVPMHIKALLIEEGAARTAVYGSYNWTAPSMWLNHEVAVVTTDADVYKALARRWAKIAQRYADARAVVGT